MRHFLLNIFLSTLLITPAVAQDVLFKGLKFDALIDVRTPSEYAAGHLDGASNLPVDQIGQLLQMHQKLRKDSVIVLYCRSGQRSAKAKLALIDQGFSQVIDGGSMSAAQQNLRNE